MTILVTGGLGKSSSRLAKLLHDASYPFLIASRKGVAGEFPAVKFDWTDKASFGNPFVHPKAKESPISAVYLVLPDEVAEAAAAAQAFIDSARDNGVKRFVLLSASAIEAGGPMHGRVHAHLRDIGVEWAVLRPTWFQENFRDVQEVYPVARESAVYSATGTGRVPFVSTDDIAAMAFHALTDKAPHNKDHLVLGPELLTYDDVASILSKGLGRPIEHRRLTEAEFKDHILSLGMPEGIASILSQSDTAISQGSEDRLSDAVEKVVGRPPIRFEDFVQRNKDHEAWKPTH